MVALKAHEVGRYLDRPDISEGVFLAYGVVGPLGTRLKAIIDEDALFYHVIRDSLVAHLHGNAAQVSVEIGRGSVPSEYQPSFQELENALNAIPPEGA